MRNGEERLARRGEDRILLGEIRDANGEDSPLGRRRRVEPPDVCSYHALNPAFPHQSTGDQWFDESQTESYRMLAYHTLKEMCDGWNPEQNAGFEGFINHVENNYLKDIRRAAAAAGAGK